MALIYEEDIKKGLSLFDIFKYQIHYNNRALSTDEPDNYEQFKCSIINLKSLNMIYENEGKVYFSELFNNWEALIINHNIEQGEYYGNIQDKIYEHHKKHSSINNKDDIIGISETEYNNAVTDYFIQDQDYINKIDRNKKGRTAPITGFYALGCCLRSNSGFRRARSFPRSALVAFFCALELLRTSLSVSSSCCFLYRSRNSFPHSSRVILRHFIPASELYLIRLRLQFQNAWYSLFNSRSIFSYK